MRKLLSSGIVVGLMAIALTGCSESVPPGYVGALIEPSGIKEEVYSQGTVTVIGRDNLVLIETASVLRPAPVSVIMADKTVDKNGARTNPIGLTMEFILNVRYRLNTNTSAIMAVLKDMKLDTTSKNIISADLVYQKYGAMVVGRVSREILGQYSPEEVLQNLAVINQAINAGVTSALENSPIIISSATLGPITLPKMITDRVNKNNEALLSLAEKAIDQQKALADEANKKELATQRATREKTEANALATQNNILGSSISPQLLEFRKIQLREKEIEMMQLVLSSGGNNTIFIPYGSADSAGAQMRMFQK